MSCAAVLAVDVVLSVVQVPLFVAFALTLCATVAAMVLMPRVEPTGPLQPGQRQSSWDLPGRAVATGALVLVVTTASGLLGPHWTGLLAPFPVATSVVAAFVHAQYGPATTARTLAGTLVGLFSFALFCLTVAVCVQPLGGVAFVVGAVVTVAVQLLVTRAQAALRIRIGAR